MADLPSEEFVAQHEVKFADLSAKIKTGHTLLLDVRKPEELKEFGWIPSSRNVAMQELDEALGLPADAFLARYGFEKPLTSDEITLTCRSGRRVKQCVPMLTKHNYNKMKLYLGSFLDWKEQGGEICTS